MTFPWEAPPDEPACPHGVPLHERCFKCDGEPAYDAVREPAEPTSEETVKARSQARAARWREDNPEKQRAQIIRQYGIRRAYALIQAAKSRAKKKSIPFDLLDHVDYYHQIINVGLCELTGLLFSKEHGSPFAPSLDRIEPKLGYVHGNVRVILFALNMGLGKWGEAPYAQIAGAYTRKISGLESTVRALQTDMYFAVRHTSVLVRSDNALLRMVVNTERGQAIPPGKCVFKDGSTIEFQDIGMPQPGMPLMTVPELVKAAFSKAVEIGLEIA